MKKKVLASILVLLCVLVGVFLVLPLFSVEEKDDGDGSEGDFFPKPPDPIELSILCAGDIMAHSSNLKAQANGDGTYDFNNNYDYVRDYIQGADVAICNIETTFPGANYTGYPAFRSPDEMAAAVAAAGFDVAGTANNHMLDSGLSGAMRTLDILRSNGLKTTGSIKESAEPRYALYEAKGVKVGVVAYTYQNTTNDRRVSINGNIAGAETASHINSFNYAYIDEDIAKVNEVVVAAREAGADIVILYYHWGEEYQQHSNQWQQYIAQQSVNTMDVDIIFGSHPHVLQEATMLYKDNWVALDSKGKEVKVENPENTPEGVTWENHRKEVPVYYSLGNFISNQRAETLNNKYTEQGVMAMVNLTFHPDTKTVTDLKMGGVTTWVDRYNSAGKLCYSIIPLDEQLDSNPVLQTSGHLNRAREAKELSYGILGIN